MLARLFWGFVGVIAMLGVVASVFQMVAPTAPVVAQPPIVAMSDEDRRKADEARRHEQRMARCQDVPNGPMDQARAMLKAARSDEGLRILRPCTHTPLTAHKDFAPLLAKLERAAELEAAKQAAQEKARKRREGVTIGMSQQDVLDSSWGRPNKINSTTTARGTREQWVYGGGYLYFENGVLVTVQH